MNLISAAEQKLESALDLVRALRAGDFPHDQSKEALADIEALLHQHLITTRRLSTDSDPDAIHNQCNVVFLALYDYLYLLGLIHRSKNATNAFELYGPLQDLARQLIGDEVKLIISSEWDLSPFTVPGVPDLPDFVWVGLPASESSNALLTPLAAHEFGHSIWRREELKPEFQLDIDNAIIDAILDRWSDYQKYYPTVTDEDDLIGGMFGVQSWKPAHEWALRQAEEIFCDFVGVRVFGESYLYAFCYLLAPGSADRGVPTYPSLPTRADNLAEAAKSYGYEPPENFADLFQEVLPAPESERRFFTEIAETAVATVTDALRSKAASLATACGLTVVDDEASAQTQSQLEKLVPDPNPLDLPALISAGWAIAHKEDVWKQYPRVQKNRHVALNELLLKSAQVLEFNRRNVT